MTTYSSKKHLKTAWVARKSQQTTEKPWGYEESWSGFNGIHGKILFIDKGKIGLKVTSVKTVTLNPNEYYIFVRNKKTISKKREFMKQLLEQL